MVFNHQWKVVLGAPPIVCAELWDMIEVKQSKVSSNQREHHLLWALMLLPTYKEEAGLAKDAGGSDDSDAVDEKTFHRWACFFQCNFFD